MRGFGALLLLAVAVLGGYNHLQVNRLRDEVASLKTSVAEPKAVRPGGGDDARVLLAEARDNLMRARKALDRGQIRTARRELDAGLWKIEKASRLAERNPANEELTEAWGQVRSQLDKLWKQFAKERPR